MYGISENPRVQFNDRLNKLLTARCCKKGIAFVSIIEKLTFLGISRVPSGIAVVITSPVKPIEA